MAATNSIARSAFDLLREGHIRALGESVRVRVHSNLRALGLGRDIDAPFSAPEARIPLHIRHLEPKDHARLFAGSVSGSGTQDTSHRSFMASFHEAEVGQCYVAANGRDEACFVQWLIGHDDNDGIEEYFGGLFPPLAADEALLEGAFTHEDSRGLAIMAHAMAKIAECSATIGAHRVLTFVPEDNIASLKGAQRAGFRPVSVRTLNWLLLRRQVSFEPLPADAKYEFEQRQPASAIAR